jgi:hypothetical protein
METYRDGIACHRELAKVKDQLVQARETEREYYRNAISSFVASVRAEGELTRERDELLRQLADANAIVARVEALTAGPLTVEHFGGNTHWVDCYKYHYDCFVLFIRAALTEPTE